MNSPSTRRGFAQRFAVTDPWLANAHGQPKIALHAMPLDLEMQHAHAAHQGLAGIFIDFDVKGRILALQQFQGRCELVAVSAQTRARSID